MGWRLLEMAGGTYSRWDEEAYKRKGGGFTKDRVGWGGGAY